MSNYDDDDYLGADIDTTLHSVEDSIVDAVEKVEHAVGRVEQAINNKSSTFAYVCGAIVFFYLLSLGEDAWYSKWRYAMWNGVDSSSVAIQSHPHDCNFLAAPLGEKYCHYDRIVSTVRWATGAQTNKPIVSYDDGKTWNGFTPEPNQKVPEHDTVEEVVITWDKKAD